MPSVKMEPVPPPATGDSALDRKLLELLPDFVTSTVPIGKEFPSLQIRLANSEAPVASEAFRELAQPRPPATTSAIAAWLVAVARTHRDRDDGRGVRAPDWQSLPSEEAQQEFRARYNRWALLNSLADLLSMSRDPADEQLLLDGIPSMPSEEARAIVARALQGAQPPLGKTVDQVCQNFPRYVDGLRGEPHDLMADQRRRPGIFGLTRDTNPACWGLMRQLAEVVLRAGPERSHAVLSPLLAPPEPAFGILNALINRRDIAQTPIWLTTLVPLAAGAFQAENSQRWSVEREALNTLGESTSAWVQVMTTTTEGWVWNEALQNLARMGRDPERRAEVLGLVRQALDGPLAAQPKGVPATRLRRLAVTLETADAPPSPVVLKYKVQGSVATDGGPVIAIPKEALAAWEGAEPPSKGRKVEAKSRFVDPSDLSAPATDYDRVCDIGKVGLLPVGDQTAIGLGHSSCEWIRLKAGGLLVLEGSIEAVHETLLSDEADDVTWHALGDVELPSGNLVVLDATQPGKGARDAIKIKLPVGAYGVSWAEIDDDRGWIWAAKVEAADGAKVKPAKKASAKAAAKKR